MELRRILCAVDFSECSHAALHAAAERARDAHAMLVLVHVEERPLWKHEPYVHLPGDVRQELLARMETLLDEWKQQARRCGAPEVVTTRKDGVPWEQIVAVAREDPSIDLIILGSHGRTGLSRALIGSVAERVVRHAPCSVTVVRPRRETGEAP